MPRKTRQTIRFPEDKPPGWHLSKAKRSRKELIAQAVRDDAQTQRSHVGHGKNILVKERNTKGRITGLVVMQTHLPGTAVVHDPAVGLAYTLIRKMRPIRVSDCVVTDKDGTPIAIIRVDPVTGNRTREPLK